MVIRRFVKIVQSEENSFQVLRSFQTEERSKTRENAKNFTSRAVLGVTHVWLGMAQA